MLRSVSGTNISFSRLFNITINGKSYEAKQGQSVLDICLANGIQVPCGCRSFYYDGQDCGLCKVLVNGKIVQNACKTLVYKGLDIKTHTPEVVKAFNESVEKLKNSKEFKSKPDFYQEEGKRNLEIMQFSMNHPNEKPPYQDRSNLWLVLDPQKCTKCGKCVSACPNGSLMLAPYVQATGNNGLFHTQCNLCGRCIEVCPEKAIMPVSTLPSIEDALKKTDIQKVAIIDYPLLINIERKLELPQGSLTPQKMALALKQLGFTLVVEAESGTDIALFEEVLTLTEHIKEHVPMISSFCPAAARTVMQRNLNSEKVLSSVLSPSFIAALMTKQKPSTLTFSFTMCEAKKQEVTRYQNTRLGYVDAALTIDELITMLQNAKIDFNKIQTNHLLPNSSKLAIQANTAKGWCEAVIEILSKEIMKAEVKKTYEKLSDNAEIIKLEYPSLGAGVGFRFGIASGTNGLFTVVGKGYNDLLYITFTECEGGCLNGIRGTKNEKEKKEELLKLIQNTSEIEAPMQNPLLKNLYTNVFKTPGSSKNFIHTVSLTNPVPENQNPQQQTQTQQQIQQPQTNQQNQQQPKLSSIQQLLKQKQDEMNKQTTKKLIY